MGVQIFFMPHCLSSFYPDFPQVDLEMSFVTQKDVKLVIEEMLQNAWPEEKGKISVPFSRLSYAEAMSLYGVDKPDTRFDWQVKGKP